MTCNLEGILKNENVHLFKKRIWGSQKSDYRQQIRQFIFDHFEKSLINSGKNLSSLPELKEGYLSISHCPNIGGFVFSDKPIGFDIEEAHRINIETVTFFSDMDELSATPDLKFLWVAKEAVYKSLHYFQQPKSIDSVKIKFEKQISKKTHSYSCTNLNDFGAESGHGVVITEDDLIFSWFIIEPKTEMVRALERLRE